MNAKKFNKETGKYDGDQYQPDSESSIRNSLQRILSERGSSLDLKNSLNFDRSRKVLKAKRKELKKMGMGNKPNATRPLEDEELQKLKQLGYFGTNTSESLQNLIWWCITTQFGYRARDANFVLVTLNYHLMKVSRKDIWSGTPRGEVKLERVNIHHANEVLTLKHMRQVNGISL